MRAIETMYAGTLFRSRLEARWAVFFDELQIKWEYEPEGFLVGAYDEVEGGPKRYLPDFHLPDLSIWVEVKGSEERLDRDLLCDAVDYGTGLPGVGCQSYWRKDVGGLLVLGPIPRPIPYTVPIHALIQHHKGAVIQWVHFEPGSVARKETYHESLGEGLAGAFYKGPLLDLGYRAVAAGHAEVNSALAAARSARFEHEFREGWRSSAAPSSVRP